MTRKYRVHVSAEFALTRAPRLRCAMANRNPIQGCSEADAEEGLVITAASWRAVETEFAGTRAPASPIQEPGPEPRVRWARARK